MRPRHAAIAFVLLGFGALYWALHKPVRTSIRTSQSSRCYAQLKQVGLATQIYANDYDGQYPVAARWMDDLQPYIEIGDERERTPENLDRALRCATTGEFYVFNSRFARANLSDDFDAATSPLAFCARKSGRNLTDDGGLWPVKPIHEMGNSRGNVVVFADAHVKMLAQKPEFSALAPRPTPKSNAPFRAAKEKP